MMIPTVHLNGTAKKNLLEELHEASTALRAAEVVLQQVTVHGRDYYVQGPHAYGQARTEMDARLAALTNLQYEIQTMYQEIQKQGR